MTLFYSQYSSYYESVAHVSAHLFDYCQKEEEEEDIEEEENISKPPK